MSVVSARAFNQSPSKVKAMAKDGPVVVTERGHPTIVVLAIEEYDRLVGDGNLRDSLRMDLDLDFEPLISHDLGRVADL